MILDVAAGILIAAAIMGLFAFGVYLAGTEGHPNETERTVIRGFGVMAVAIAIGIAVLAKAFGYL